MLFRGTGSVRLHTALHLWTTKNVLSTFNGHQEFSQCNQLEPSLSQILCHEEHKWESKEEILSTWENKKVSDTFAMFQWHTFSSANVGSNVFSTVFFCTLLPSLLKICRMSGRPYASHYLENKVTKKVMLRNVLLTDNNGCLPDIFSDYSLKAAADTGVHHKNVCMPVGELSYLFLIQGDSSYCI